MCWLHELCAGFLVILLRQLTESKTDPVPHQLVSQRAAHTDYQERPAHVFQHTFVTLPNQVLYVVPVRAFRLPLTERHVANTAGDFDNLLRFCRLRRAVPVNSLLLEEWKKSFNIKTTTAYEIHLLFHGRSPAVLIDVFLLPGTFVRPARSRSFRRLSNSCNFWFTSTRFLRSYSTISCLFFRFSTSA